MVFHDAWKWLSSDLCLSMSAWLSDVCQNFSSYFFIIEWKRIPPKLYLTNCQDILQELSVQVLSYCFKFHFDFNMYFHCYYPSPTCRLNFMHLQQTTFENIMPKGEIVHCEKILHLPQCSLLVSIIIPTWSDIFHSFA